MDVCTAYPSHASAEVSNTDEDKLVEEIVMKLRKIGDEFNENASLRMELSQIVKDCIKAVLRKRITEKLCEMASFMNVIGWIE